MTPEEADEIRCRLAAKWSKDPLLFAQKAFPWGKGELADFKGPDKWQTSVLEYLRDGLRAGAGDDVLRVAVASGHGIGKSCLTAWLILWAMSTFPDCRVLVTANTEAQLRTKTWPELAKWHRLSIFRDWFEFTATTLASTQPGHDKTWRADAIAWSENNTEAFAGLHNKGRRELVLFDEASAISDRIWEVTEGALTDSKTQILWLAFGNPTRNTGRFFDCFGRLRNRWHTMNIDSRDAAITNKKQLAQWAADYGEDSDFFKVRVRGIFPSQSSNQFISRALVDAAMERNPEQSIGGFAAMVGVDVARFGDDSTVIATRVGRDATLPLRQYHGLKGTEVARTVQSYIEELKARGYKRIYVALDGTGVGGPVCDILNDAGYRVEEVNFGAVAHDASRYRNRRCEIWGRMRDWLAKGAIPKDEQLAMDLTGLEYAFDDKGRYVLERKEDLKRRGLPSPDKADALALTFACDVIEDDSGISMPVRQMKPYNPLDIGL